MFQQIGECIHKKEHIQKSGMDGKGTDISTGIGDDTQIRRALIDKNARIGRNVMVCRIMITSVQDSV